jgi:signal transduction histidine kinase
MDKLTSNMLLLAQMDAGQLHLEQEVLSLAEVARGIATVHHGRLALTSEPGKGTTATLSLPLAER